MIILIDTMKSDNFKPESLCVAMHKEVFIDFNHSQAFLLGKINMIYTRKCCCECGGWAKPGNRYINGHNRKGQKQPETSGNNNVMKRPEVIAKVTGINHWTYGLASKDHPKYGIKQPNFSGKNHPFFGQTHTKEVCENQRQRMLALGKNHPWNKPKYRNISNKRWIGDNNPSKKPENVAKISKRMKENNPMAGIYGKDHPSWKGGPKPYCDLWLDKEYKQSIRDRDNNKCQNPNCKGNYNPNHKLCVHHINGNKINCHPWNLITLCRGCNKRAEGNKKISRKWWQELYQKIMTKKYGYKYE